MSVTAPPPSAQRGDPEALIEEAWQRARCRRRRRRIATITGAVIVGIGVLACLALSNGSTAANDRAKRPPTLAPSGKTGRYLYTRAVVAPRGPATLAGVTTIENWVGSDGTWRLRETLPGRAAGSLDMLVSGDGLLPPQANATASLDGAPINDRDPGDGLFTARDLESLPTNVSALKARLEHAVIAQQLRNLDAYVGPGPHRAAQLKRLRPVFLAGRTADTLIAIAGLDMSPLPGGLAPALYRVARALPGVRATNSHDAVGRAGVQVAGGGFALIFDPHTGALRSTTTGTFFDQGTAGTIVAQAPVADAFAIPRGLRPIRSLVARPPAITLIPATGSPATSFTLQVRIAPSQTAAKRSPLVTAQMFGPTGPNCRYWVSRPPVARITPGPVTQQRGLAFATYRITPAAIGHRAWCPGRYQLMLTPFPSPTRPVVPRSFTAAYFTIR